MLRQFFDYLKSLFLSTQAENAPLTTKETFEQVENGMEVLPTELIQKIGAELDMPSLGQFSGTTRKIHYDLNSLPCVVVLKGTTDLKKMNFSEIIQHNFPEFARKVEIKKLYQSYQLQERISMTVFVLGTFISIANGIYLGHKVENELSNCNVFFSLFAAYCTGSYAMLVGTGTSFFSANSYRGYFQSKIEIKQAALIKEDIQQSDQNIIKIRYA